MVSVLRCLATLLCISAGVSAAGIPVYVRPQIDELRRADAILVLSGPHHVRYPYAFALAAQGWAPNLVISNPDPQDDPKLTAFCGAPHGAVTVRCFRPDPATTKGEGRELRRLAGEYGWRTVIVVTFRPHVSRARYVLQQCFDGALIVVASDERISGLRWSFEYLYQTAGYVRAIVQPGC